MVRPSYIVWNQGTYNVQNKHKYIGSKVPEYRSGLELKCMQFFDFNSQVVRWSSEPFSIKYLLESDGKEHNYWIDFYAEIMSKDGSVKKYLIEVKPFKQCLPPNAPKINNKKAIRRYMYENDMFTKNQCKWKSARIFARSQGMEFKILTDKEIGG